MSIRTFSPRLQVALGLGLALAAPRPARGVELGIAGPTFTLDGRPAFLLGVSYYGALGAPEDFIRRDLEDLQRHGFHWLRVWATWAAFGNDVSAVDAEGRAREPYLAKLVWLVAECNRRGLVVDVTLSRIGSPRRDHFGLGVWHGRPACSPGRLEAVTASRPGWKPAIQQTGSLRYARRRAGRPALR